MKKELTTITAIIDTREQNPLDLGKYGLKVETATLPWGDYSLKGMEKIIALERKSIEDFTTCCGNERSRFDREILALRGYPVKAIVCEFKMSDVLNHAYRSKVTPAAVVGSMERWLLYGIPFLMAESHEGASWIVAGILEKAWADFQKYGILMEMDI